jgi:hypothetical protein
VVDALLRCEPFEDRPLPADVRERVLATATAAAAAAW